MPINAARAGRAQGYVDQELEQVGEAEAADTPAREQWRLLRGVEHVLVSLRHYCATYDLDFNVPVMNSEGTYLDEIEGRT